MSSTTTSSRARSPLSPRPRATCRPPVAPCASTEPARRVKSPVGDLLGIDIPIFAFRHCRDVGFEVTKAGGVGVLGATGYTPEQLDTELRLIENALAGRPYGVDVLLP